MRDRDGVLGGLHPDLVLAVGESQSAMFLTTYVNAVDPLAHVYDGFLIHSRFGPAAPLDGASILHLSGAGALSLTRFRRDLRVPLVAVITETDLIGSLLPGYHAAAQPDNERLRVWEIAGAAHADNYTIKVGFIDSGFAPLDDLVAAYAPTNTLMGHELSHCINFGPQHHYVVQAALAWLQDWVRDGKPAPAGGRLELTDTHPPRLVLDDNGLARGGVRTPWVHVPVAKTSGIGSDETIMSTIFGCGETFDAATLGKLYPGGQPQYLERFTQALDEAIASGFILAADRQEILELAAATYPGTES